MAEPIRLLLDTCTFLWVVGGAAELSRAARKAFSDPGNEVYLSAASAGEIAVKHRLGRLPLPSPPDAFVPAQRAAHGIEPLAVGEEAALQVAKLPDLHRDPFDRTSRPTPSARSGSAARPQPGSPAAAPPDRDSALDKIRDTVNDCLNG